MSEKVITIPERIQLHVTYDDETDKVGIISNSDAGWITMPLDQFRDVVEHVEIMVLQSSVERGK